jgi:hypothetical protein
MGSNPAEILKGPRKGLRVLAGEEDLARQLVKSLDAEQRKATIFSETAPKEIFTEAKRRVQPLETQGISAARLKPAQRRNLVKLIEEYVHRVRPDVAGQDLKKIENAGIEKISFAWAGGIEKGEGHYYRVQGPTFLLEYDNTQNNNNHNHAVWRDLENDFGEDLLRNPTPKNAPAADFFRAQGLAAVGVAPDGVERYEAAIPSLTPIEVSHITVVYETGCATQ